MRFHQEAKRKLFERRLLEKRNGIRRYQHGGFVFSIGFGITCLVWGIRAAILAARVARVAMTVARVVKTAATVGRAAATVAKIGRAAGKIAVKGGKVVKKVAGRAGRTARKRNNISSRSLPDFAEPGSGGKNKKKKKEGAPLPQRHPYDRTKTVATVGRAAPGGRRGRLLTGPSSSPVSLTKKMSAAASVLPKKLPPPHLARFSRWDGAKGAYTINIPFKKLNAVQIDSNRRLALAGF